MNAADLAHAITLEDLSRDPYPLYRDLRAHAPVAWAPRLGMWLVTRYDDVRATLLDHEAFTTASAQSLIAQTFGENMLASEGERHRLYRTPQIQASFSPRAIAPYLNARIEARVRRLLDAIVGAGEADLRSSLAARLPVLVMLDLFGLPDEDEPRFRAWYDSFEAALSNHGADAEVAASAARNVAAFHEHFEKHVERGRVEGGESLIALMAGAGLSDADVRRNALIVFFGGISTVEALILNTLWALLQHPHAWRAVQADRQKVDAAITETMRWLSPVQSATRFCTRDAEIGGVRLQGGAVVNCMLGAANRDEAVFEHADRFDLERANASRHLGFATGPHLCIGRHLARAEAFAAVAGVLQRLPGLQLQQNVRPEGHEFRQPRSLSVSWRT